MHHEVGLVQALNHMLVFVPNLLANLICEAHRQAICRRIRQLRFGERGHELVHEFIVELNFLLIFVLRIDKRLVCARQHRIRSILLFTA